MLHESAFDQWCHQLALSEQTRGLIAQIRSSPPSRLVRSAAGNVSGRYPSRKMNCTIQFESHRGELAFIYQVEHDSAVYEFYDQPQAIKLTYPGKDGKRRVTTWHTPDFFVIREESAGWTECKMQEQLLELAQKQPHRYQQNADGTWSCPPGEAYAQSLGLFYRIHSSRDIDWIYQRNLRFLEDYLRGPLPLIAEAVVTAIRTTVMRAPGISLLDLLQSLHDGTADDVYVLLVTDQVYADLSSAPLADPERVHLFLDREMANAYTALSRSSLDCLPRPSVITLAEDMPLCWDGKPWVILNLGETGITLLSPDKRVKTLPHEVVDTLLSAGHLTAVPSQRPDNRHQAARARLEKASPQHLEVATQRSKALSPFPPTEQQVSLRTRQRWRARIRAAEVACDNGYVGLLPDWGNCGNRLPRFPEETEKLIERFITQHYETLKQQPKKEVYLLLEREAEKLNIPAPTYKTFCRRIKQRPRGIQTHGREGPRAAAAVEPWVWELEQTTTPRHGDRPWEVVHLDHTLLDIELVSARTGRALGRPWVTFMTDAFSRRLLVVYLTFDPPSYRSCLMTLRECVWRYGRLPQTLIVDGGPDFRSTYFETLLAYYGSTKATRPWAKPRYGSVIERLFGTANTQFVHNLLGNTQIMKKVRQVTKFFTAREQAVWTLGDLYAYLTEWAYEVYDLAMHPALGTTPRDAYTSGLLLGGQRAHLKILYNDDFRFLSLATTQKGLATIEPGRGIRVNYVYYWSESFRRPTVEDTQVAVRYDPFDIGLAYAYVQGRWVQCLSEYYLQLHGHTERELQIASAELRKRYQKHTGDAAITAKRLAALLASAQEHETLLLQRLQDLEARDVMAQLGGYCLGQDGQSTSVHEPNRQRQTSWDLQETTTDLILKESDDEGLEDLEEYGEYR